MAIVELAAAAVPIFPSVRGLQKNIARELAPTSSIAGRVGGETGSRFRAAFSKSVSGVASALGSALKAGALAGGAVAAAAGAVGIKTAAQMETAQISFTTMLGSGEKARAFLGELSSFAAKTPFDLPGLQTSAQSLVSAGISADKVIPIMTTLGNVTSGMGTGAEGIQRATVAIQQMNAAGKIQAEDLNQLRDAGIPVYDLLAAATGKSKEQLAEMIDKGKLGRKELDQLMSALESGKGFERFNGLMDAQSRSLTGLWATLKDTFSVGMAEAIGPAIPLLKDGLAGAITAVGAVMPHVEAGLAGMVSGIQGFVRGITGDVEIMSTSTRPKLELFGLGVRALWLAFQDGDVTSDGFVGVMERIGVALGKARDAGRAFIENLRSGDTSSVGGSFRSIGESLGVLVPKLIEAGTSAVPVLNTAISAGADVLAFMADNTWLLAGAIPALTAGFVAWKTLQTANTVLGRQSAIGMGLQVASTIALAASNRALASSQHAVIASQAAAATSRGAMTAATGAQTAATSANTVATTTNTTAQNSGILARGRAAVAVAAQRAATIATTVATKAAAAGQWLLNAALTANPIGIVVVALAALAGGLVLAWKHSDTFRSIVMGAWEGVKSAASSVASWFTATAVPAFRSALAAVGSAFSWLNSSVIQPVWTGIRFTVAVVAGTLMTVFDGLVWVVRNTLGPVFTWLYNKAIKPAFDWARAKVEGFRSWFDATRLRVQGYLGALGARFVGLYNDYVRPALDWVRTKVGDVLNWFNVKRLETQMRLQMLGLKFLVLYNAHVRPVFDWVRAKIGDVLNWFNVKRLEMQTRLHLLGLKFLVLYNAHVRPVFDWIRDKIGGVWDWVRTKAFDPMSRFARETIPNAFRAAQEGVGKQWEKLRGIVRGPVDFFVNTVYNEGLRPNINTVMEKVGLDEKHRLPKMNMPQGFIKGGRTGGSSKYEERGPVHGKEFVVNAARTEELDRKAPGLLDGIHRHGAKALAKFAPGSPTYGRSSFVGPQFNRNFHEREVYFGGDSAAKSHWFLNQAINAWNGLAGIRLRMGFNPSKPYVHARESGYIPGGAGIPNWAGFYSGSQIQFNPAARRMSAIGRRTVAIHEVGHALGLPHAHRGEGGNGAWSIMNYDNMYAHNSVTAADAAALRAIYPGKATRQPGGLGDPGGGGGILDAILNPIKKIVDGIADKVIGRFRGNVIADLVGGMAKTLGRGIWDWLVKQATSLGGLLGGGDSAKSGGPRIIPELHDQGGIIRPGVNVIENRTRKPEVSVNPRQWDITRDAIAAVQDQAVRGGGGGWTSYGPVYAVDAQDLWRQQLKEQSKREALYARS